MFFLVCHCERSEAIFQKDCHVASLLAMTLKGTKATCIRSISRVYFDYRYEFMNKRGQSIIEYSLIAILVLLGIVYMGPYVLRSIDAHFKLWDDSAQDSFTENITQAPVNEIVFTPPTCNCSYVDGGCGNPTQCGSGYHILNLVCSANSPQGCSGQPLSICGTAIDPKCCAQYSSQGCGTIPIPAGDTDINNDPNNIPGEAPCPTNMSCNTPSPGSLCPTDLNGTCLKPPASTPNNCYFGQRIWATSCSTSSFQCVNDPTCNPQCLGTLSTGALACPGAVSNLGQNYAYSYVDDPTQSDCGSSPHCTYCSSSAPCQMYCDAANGYSLNSTGTACVKLICPAGPLPTNLPNYTEATAPPLGQNYYFFNFASHGIQGQTVLTPGFVTPGQTYHLAMVAYDQSSANINWCRQKNWDEACMEQKNLDPGHCTLGCANGEPGDCTDNHCGALETHNGINEYICDKDISKNDSTLLHLQIGDETPQDQHCSEWQILDQNYKVVFAWAGTVDYYMDAAFTPADCSGTTTTGPITCPKQNLTIAEGFCVTSASFPQTTAGSNASGTCVGGGTATATCNTNGKWGQAFGSTSCHCSDK